jgi:hypothetical protein
MISNFLPRRPAAAGWMMLALWLGAASTPVRAQSAGAAGEDYRALVLEAVQEFDRQQYEEALNLFRQAYRLRPSSRVLRGMGKALFELGRYTEAESALQEALSATVDPLPDRLRDDVVALLDRTDRYIGVLELSVEPADAQVTVDGRGVEAGTIRLDIGDHQLEASREGYEPVRRTVDIIGRETTALTLTLEPEVAPVIVQSPPPSRSSAPLILGASFTAVGGAGLAASLVWFFDRNDALDRCNQVADAGVECSNFGAINDQRTFAIVATAVSGATLALGGSLLIWHLTRSDPEPEPAPIRAACGPSADGAFCHASLRF